MSHAIKIQNIQHAFGDRVALNGVSFQVDAGAIFGLLGPNGGGKSTLFRILSTLLRADQGSAEIFGHSVQAQADAVRRDIGIVFQSPSLDKELSVYENLHFQGAMYGLSGKELRQRIDELLERFQLTERVREKVKVLSGGLARRVEIAKSMVHRPKLLLLDEPSTGLDPGVRRDVWAMLKKLQSEDGVTVLLTTHIMEEAEECDQLAILDRGNLIATGSPEALKNEMSGEVIRIECQDPESLCQQINESLQLSSRVICSRVRLEDEHGYDLMVRLREAFGDQIRSLTLGKPSLEDVFLKKTGHSFFSSDEETAA